MASIIPTNVSHVASISTCYDTSSQITGDTLLSIPGRIRGKVRDQYHLKDGKSIALVTTDRQSAFDKSLASVPFKGAVLNMTSGWWFEKTKHIIPNHVISTPHPNVTVAKKCLPFAIEFVVRSFCTGSTSTSIWKNYNSGVRNYCGHALPEGLVKNCKLPMGNLLTPTTKDVSDRPISCEDIVKEGIMTQEDLDVCGNAALELFAFGQAEAATRGLILVDTKYEMGKDLETGEITLIDEVHTPDSSRYWIAGSYAERFEKGLEPESVDKEFLRLWFAERCDPYKDEVLPEAPKYLVCELARRYVGLYEMITGEEFKFENMGEEGIVEALKDLA